MAVSKVVLNSTTLIDITDTTAVAADVAQSEVFYGADGVRTTGTASVTPAPSIKTYALRPDAELVKTYSYDKLIYDDEGVTIPSYTTTVTPLKASASVSPAATLSLDDYDYFIVTRMLSIPEYSIDTIGAGRLEYVFSSVIYEIVDFPADSISSIQGSGKKTARTVIDFASTHYSLVAYWSGASTFTTYANTAYGTYQTPQLPTLSSSTSSTPDLTFNSPIFNVRGSTSYFKNTYFNAMTDIRYQWVTELYRTQKRSLASDGWSFSNCMHGILSCVDSASHTLV